jgi:hypothetical protein
MPHNFKPAGWLGERCEYCGYGLSDSVEGRMIHISIVDKVNHIHGLDLIGKDYKSQREKKL